MGTMTDVVQDALLSTWGLRDPHSKSEKRLNRGRTAHFSDVFDL